MCFFLRRRVLYSLRYSPIPSGVAISATSTTAEVRKAYLKLSLKIHPDKNGSSPESKVTAMAVSPASASKT